MGRCQSRTGNTRTWTSLWKHGGFPGYSAMTVWIPCNPGIQKSSQSFSANGKTHPIWGWRQREKFACNCFHLANWQHVSSEDGDILIFLPNPVLIQYNFAPIFLTIRKLGNNILFETYSCVQIYRNICQYYLTRKKNNHQDVITSTMLFCCLTNHIFKREKENQNSPYSNILDSLWNKISNYTICFRIYDSEKSISFLVLFIFQLSRWSVS